MKKTFITFALLLSIFGGLSKAFAQTSCPNSDFSMGNFTYWTGSTDSVSGIVIPGIIAGIPNSLPFTSGSQTIMNTYATDPNTGGFLSVIPPGGTSSCRLGNALCEHCNASARMSASLEYTIPISKLNCLFICQYALVLQHPTSYLPNEMPKFSIFVLDSAGNNIGGACGIYNATAQSGTPGYHSCFPLSSACAKDTVLWKDWSFVSFDLAPFINKNVIIQFTIDNGVSKSDFGYVYFSNSCSALRCTQLCTGSNDTIKAPSGFIAYSWTKPPSTTVLGTNQSITINNPVNGTKYSCLLISVSGCQYTVYDTCYCTTNINSYVEQIQSNISNAYPNPNNGSTQIDYSLPPGLNEGEIVFYDLQGTEVKRFKVDRTFTTLLVSTKELAAGTYYYQLQTTGDSSGGKKMVVIK
jgi:hypothetical protein